VSALSATAIVLWQLLAVASAAGETPGEAPAAPPLLPHLRVEQYELESGLTVVLAETPSPLAAVGMYYRAGATRDPPGRGGLAHIAEHVGVDEASRTIDRWTRQRVLTDAGAVVTRGRTWQDYTGYEMLVPAPNVAVQLWLEADRLRNSSDIDPGPLDVVRHIVRQELLQGEDQPGGRAYGELMAALFPAGHPYHRQVIGTEAEVAAATRADVRAFFATWYRSTGAVLVVVGAIDRAAVRAAVARYFRELPRAAVPAPLVAPPLVRDERVPVRVASPEPLRWTRAAWSAPARLDRDEPAAALLAEVLSARLATGPATLGVDYVRAPLGGMLVVASTALYADPRALVERVDRELTTLAATPPTPDELERAERRRETLWLEDLDAAEGPFELALALRDYAVLGGGAAKLPWDHLRYRDVRGADVARIAGDLARRSRRVVLAPAGAAVAVEDRP